MKIKLSNKGYITTNSLLALYGVAGAIYSFKKSKVASAIFATTSLISLSNTCITLDKDFKPESK